MIGWINLPGQQSKSARERLSDPRFSYPEGFTTEDSAMLYCRVMHAGAGQPAGYLSALTPGPARRDTSVRVQAP